MNDEVLVQEIISADLFAVLDIVFSDDDLNEKREKLRSHLAELEYILLLEG